jgi:LacI family transcriptional regulator
MPDVDEREGCPSPTIRRLAEVVGCSKSAVARVLKHQAGVAPAIRERVLKMAAAEGYRPDPELARVMGRLRGRKKARAAANLAWLRYGRAPEAPQDYPWFAPIWEGARRRAEELGYRLDQVIEDSRRLSVTRLREILLARGVAGLVESPPWRHESYASFDASPFAVAIAGESDRPYVMHQSGPDHFHNMRMLMRELRGLGYRRPALVASDYIHVVSAGTVVAGFETEKLELPPEDRVPWHSRISDQKPEELAAWLRVWRPDVLICGNNTWEALLRSLGWRVPEQIGLAHINLAADVAEWGGIDQNHVAIGAGAVDLLAMQLVKGERGAPASPVLQLVAGRFVKGRTLRAQ